MKEHNKNFYSLEELKRVRDCYEDYQDGEEVYYFVGALRYACDEIERLNKELSNYKFRPKTQFRYVIELRDRINQATRHLEILLEIALEQDSENVNLIDRLKGILDILNGVDKE